MIILIYPRILWFLVINHLFTFKNTVSTGQNKKWLPLYWSFHLLFQEYDCLICEFFHYLIHSPIMWPSVTRLTCRAYVFRGRRPPKFLVTGGHKILWDTGDPYSWPEAAMVACGRSPQGILSHISRRRPGWWSDHITNLSYLSRTNYIGLSVQLPSLATVRQSQNLEAHCFQWLTR